MVEGGSIVKREDIRELHYITAVCNVGSIMRGGILSHELASRLGHESVADQEVQDKREARSVPGGLPLHQYANLYITARNPMLFRVLRHPSTPRSDVCVLAVSPAVLDIEDVVITDMNASSEYSSFRRSPDGLSTIDKGLVFAKYWTHPENPIAEMRHKSIKCAEVLVPRRIPPSYITKIYVPDERQERAVRALCPQITIPVIVNGNLFFK